MFSAPYPRELAHPRTSSPSVPPRARTAVLVSSDLSFRQRVRDTLSSLRWQVREASGGAEALGMLDAESAETLVVDTWLPDLEVTEFLAECQRLFAEMDVVALGDVEAAGRGRSPRRNEVLLAVRRGQDGDGAAWNAAPVIETSREISRPLHAPLLHPENSASLRPSTANIPSAVASLRLPEFIGEDAAMLEVSRRIRLVAPRPTPVLIQGPTGTGKELVARALHRLSPRSSRPFAVLNCAAIPESLLEAELFGHTRGAFTGAVQGRTGRIEAAHGGTLFLDEIGEMPLPLQAKLLRFLESGELQRIGDNEAVKVDVRLVAATHRPLARMAREASFRLDLYHRLSVFSIRTPALAGRVADIDRLTEFFLARLAERSAARSLSFAAREQLRGYSWPGNVRELEHVLERAWILAEERAEIGVAEIEFGNDEESA
ncbi:sigma 54-interacting transcriptional regulator [Silvibacterium sp.]|uniref:sigma 54-interacting transcriptional regulator n=1 Tax=Silvibacterium sp. TaxID=1964179 RepID=UPI0039E22645